MIERTERMSAAEWRKHQGLPPPGADKTPTKSPLYELLGPCPSAGKAHHALGRLKAGEMNKTEARYEREVLAPAKARGEVTWYAFEAIKLRLANRTFLTVDFFVLYPDRTFEAVDVKGAKAIIEEDAKVKMKVAAEAFPFRFKFAYPKPRNLGGGWFIQDVSK